MKPRPWPINVEQADAHGSDVFFEALLQSCTTPTRSSSDYESTPEPFGHRDAPNLHWKRSKIASPGQTDEEIHTRRLRAQGPMAWPTRTSSIIGAQRYMADRHASSRRTSFESFEEAGLGDGYDHYSDAQHDVLRTHGFWPRSRSSIGEPVLGVERPRQDYDTSRTIHRGSHGKEAHVTSPRRRLAQLGNARGLWNEAHDPRRSLLFEPHDAAKRAYTSILAVLSSAGMSIQRSTGRESAAV